MTGLAVVGDIGGTNIRLALADLSNLSPRIGTVFRARCDEFSSPEDALATFLRARGVVNPSRMVLAVAGPVVAGAVQMTNRAWTVSEDRFKTAGYERVRVINDFSALALATMVLPAAALLQIGPSRSIAIDAPRLVVGPGTGLGAAILVPGDATPLVISTEAGHAGFAPSDVLDRAILQLIARDEGHIPVERLLSGSGLVLLHSTLASINGREPPRMTASQITDAGLSGEQGARRTLELFWELVASAAGDFALACGARGGVYLAGGILPKIISTLDVAQFRARFESKGAMAPYLRAIPVSLILDPDAALIGAAQMIFHDSNQEHP